MKLSDSLGEEALNKQSDVCLRRVVFGCSSRWFPIEGSEEEARAGRALFISPLSSPLPSSWCQSFFFAEIGSALDREAATSPVGLSFLMCEMGFGE